MLLPPTRECGKVMFSVCLLTGGGGVPRSGGTLTYGEFFFKFFWSASSVLIFDLDE